MGIKNYQGVFLGAQKEDEQFQVADFMNKDIITFNPEQNILEVMDSLIRNGISGGPIVSHEGCLLGIISEGDCIKQITESKYYNMPMEDMSVQRYMTREVITVRPEDNLMDTANKFLTIRKRRFPVVDAEGKLIGMISQKNVLKAALDWTGNHWQNNHK